MEWLKTIAPMIGTAIGGPLGGAALAFVADKLGIQEKTIDAVSSAISNGRMTPEQVVAIKSAELDFQRFLEENEIKLEDIAAQDRKSARELLISTKSKVPAMLSFLVTVGYFAILIGMMTGSMSINDSQALLIMLGSLSTAWGMVMAYWFGTTSGSAQKNDLLANSSKQK